MRGKENNLMSSATLINSSPTNNSSYAASSLPVVKIFLVLIVIILLPRMVNAETNVSSCQQLSSANTIYTLNASINSNSGACFNITANNVTLDGKGFSLSYALTSNGTAVYSNGFAQLTIKNMMINQTNTTRVRSPAIWLESSYGHNITNNSLLIYGEDNPDAYNYGIYLLNTTNTTIDSNNISMKSTCDYCHGIYLLNNSNYGVITNNNITTAGGYNHGI